MTVYTYPGLRVVRFEMSLIEMVLGSRSSFNGASQIIDVPAERWGVTLDYPPYTYVGAIPAEAFWIKVGRFNVVQLWHMLRPIPRGTMRGSPTLAVGAAQGATSITIQTDPGVTLLEGDVPGVNGQWLYIVTGGTANGSGLLTVEFRNRLRSAAPLGTAVVWNRPLANFRVASSIPPFSYAGQVSQPFSIGLEETY